MRTKKAEPLLTLPWDVSDHFCGYAASFLHNPVLSHHSS